MNKKYCCSKFQDSLKEGTDNECYGALIYYLQGYYTAGTVGRINFCPFCGKKIKQNKA